MASRILGMGDILTMIEKAQESIDEEANEDGSEDEEEQVRLRGLSGEHAADEEDGRCIGAF